jgi:hypothetical protein
MTLVQSAEARGGGGGHGGGFGGGGFHGGGFGGRGFGYGGGWGYGGWGYPYYGYGYGPYYGGDDYYDDERPVVIHRYHVVHDHYCRIVRKRVHTCCGWTWRKVRYCTR